jgi:hypothetical protein
MHGLHFTAETNGVDGYFMNSIVRTARAATKTD